MKTTYTNYDHAQYLKLYPTIQTFITILKTTTIKEIKISFIEYNNAFAIVIYIREITTTIWVLKTHIIIEIGELQKHTLYYENPNFIPELKNLLTQELKNNHQPPRIKTT